MESLLFFLQLIMAKSKVLTSNDDKKLKGNGIVELIIRSKARVVDQTWHGKDRGAHALVVVFIREDLPYQ